ncbi:MAG TPA: ABC transporter permease subunit [Caulobacteraceae bacterium]|jgi:iron(III) transport system permease protein
MALTDVPAPEAMLARRAGWSAPSPLRIAALLAALFAVAPLLFIAALAVQPAAGASPELLRRYAADTVVLALGVGLLTTALGSAAAWLVVMHRFPGRGAFEWLLALPLAAPAYALAYAYSDLLDVAGPVQTALRDAGMGGEFLQVRSLPGAVFVLSAAFYPYVYLTARAAFVSQSVCALEAARTLGCGPWAAYRRVALPLARPALVAGAALALMETLADYGAVSYLGVQTLTTGVVRAFAAYGSPAGAARLSLALLAAAALLLVLERRGRRGQGYGASSARWRELPAVRLRGAAGWGATAFCTLLLTAALLLPCAWLAVKALSTTTDAGRLLRAGSLSLALAIGGCVLTTALAAVIAFGARGRPLPARLASLGYATPGAVMAIGLLGPAALIWRGTGAGAGAAVALGLLMYAYVARLAAAALEPIDAGLTRVTPSMERAARMLGESEGGALARVHAPLAKGAFWTAALLVFVDVLKELPATLILRPFNFDTLAVLAHGYAADERLAQAAWPALAIVLLAAGPVALLSRQIARSRPGFAR